MDELRGFFEEAFKRPDRVNELIQATAVDIFKKLAMAPDDPELFRGWVHSFAGMKARESTRDRGRERARAGLCPGDVPLESPSSTVLGRLLDEQQRRLVIEHAQLLRPVYCRALLHVLDGGDYKSLAAREGIPEPTAWTRISRAVVKVRRSIQAARRTRPEYRSTPTNA